MTSGKHSDPQQDRASSRNRYAGHVYIELYLLAALALISLAVGISRYQKEGLWGVAMGAIVTAAIIILGGVVVVYGLGAISLGHEKLEAFAFYRAFVSVIMHLSRLLMFIGVAAFVWMIMAVRFDLADLWGQRFILVMSVITGLVLFVIHRFSRKAFWLVFGLFCGGLLFFLFGAVFGLLLGDIPLHVGPLKGMDLGAVAALVIYTAWIIRLKFKKVSKK